VLSKFPSVFFPYLGAKTAVGRETEQKPSCSSCVLTETDTCTLHDKPIKKYSRQCAIHLAHANQQGWTGPKIVEGIAHLSNSTYISVSGISGHERALQTSLQRTCFLLRLFNYKSHF
jgi:hypothetical protein